LRDTETDVVSGPDLKSDAIQSRVEKQQWRMGPCPGVIDEDPGVDIHREERRILCTTWHWKWKGSRWRVIKSGKEKALKRWLQRGALTLKTGERRPLTFPWSRGPVSGGITGPMGGFLCLDIKLFADFRS